MEYNHLQEIPIISLRNRLLLLHHISELFCPCIPMFDLEGRLDETGQGPSVGFDTLRGILISQGKVFYQNVSKGEICNGNREGLFKLFLRKKELYVSICSVNCISDICILMMQTSFFVFFSVLHHSAFLC